jgi:N-acylglucosamine-6-phosphate 2-epimerase
MTVTEKIRGKLVVSCQASEESPFHDPSAISLMVRAAIIGGASAIRVEGNPHVGAVAGLGAPLIGLVKRREPGSEVYITPRAGDVRDLVRAGAAVVAMDATRRDRPGAESLADLVKTAHELGALVMGDVDSLDSAIFAQEMGVDWVGTTLSGYTTTSVLEDPDLALVATLAQHCSVPVIAEGRYSRPDQVEAAFLNGAWSVVVGTAISDPVKTTRRFAAACPPRTEA